MVALVPADVMAEGADLIQRRSRHDALYNAGRGQAVGKPGDH